MTVEKIGDWEYISVDEARQQLGLGYKDMAMLLDAKALRLRRDYRGQTIQWVLAEDVRDAVAYLTRYREEERKRLDSLFSTKGRDEQEEDKSETIEGPFFTFSPTDIGTLLMALVSYFDAERDVYFGLFDDRGDIRKTVDVISRIYLWLEKDAQAGRPLTETIDEIYEQRPDERARREVFLYLLEKARTRNAKR